MKARVIAIVPIILLMILRMGSCSNEKYPSGRDTVESYGDGTFQIVGRNPSGVFYAGEGGPLISYVDRYYEDGDTVYIFGHEYHHNDILIYGIIDANNNMIHVYFTKEVYLDDRLLESPSIVFLQDFSDFPEKAQEIFGKMANGELGKKLD